MRGADAGLSFPPLILALAVVAVLGSGVNDVALAFALVFSPASPASSGARRWPSRRNPSSRRRRRSVRRPRRIVLARILPNVLTGLVVGIAIALGAASLTSSGLSFLGLGPPPPAASWGSMLEEAYNTALFTHPWSLVPSGLVIAVTVLAFNTLGDAMRDTVSGATTKGRSRHGRTQRGLTAVSQPAGAVRAAAAVVVDGDGDGTEGGATTTALLEVRGLCIEFDTEADPVRVVDEASFEVGRGKIVGLVGESGCGKTVSSLAILRLLASPPAHIVGGSIRFDGRELLDADFNEMRQIRGRDIAMVFQDPLASLDPTFTIGSQLLEAMRLHEKLSRAAARARAVELLRSVHIPDPARRLSAYPHQLSGGMRQRVMIAMALSCYPRLLIADEPTTALDVTIQAQIVELLHELCESQDLSVLFVTHDLALISELSDEIAVMYAGEVVEQAPTAELFARPRHPYTAALLAASPGAVACDGRSALLDGAVPQAGLFPAGCRFHPRCAFAEDDCRHEPIALEVLDGERRSRCRRTAGARAARHRRGRRRNRPACEGAGRAMNVATPREAAGAPTAAEPGGRAARRVMPLRCPPAGAGQGHGARGRRRRPGRGPGHHLGLVGESGSGKSTLARVLLRLIPPTTGRVLLGGEDITEVKGARLRTLRRRMQLVFQDPYSSFDPLATIGASVGEALSVHTALGRPERDQRVAELLDQVRLPATFAGRHPRQLSGGQLQRAAIARALATEPELLALDEPLSSLDVATQVQMVGLLGELQDRLGIAYLFISHDLNLVRSLSQRVAVMYLGRIVEEGPVDALYATPQHPYTQALLSASPTMDPARRRQRIVLEGDIPSPLNPPSGCRFRTRCRYAMDVCATAEPRANVVDGLTVRCYLTDLPPREQET